MKTSPAGGTGAAGGWHAYRFLSRMISQPASSPVVSEPDRVFGPFDPDLAHRTAPRPSQPAERFSLPTTTRDASPSYCFWPTSLVSRP